MGISMRERVVLRGQHAKRASVPEAQRSSWPGRRSPLHVWGTMRELHADSDVERDGGCP
jgi:hypothetical protein